MLQIREATELIQVTQVHLEGVAQGSARQADCLTLWHLGTQKFTSNNSSLGTDYASSEVNADHLSWGRGSLDKHQAEVPRPPDHNKNVEH